LPFVQKFKRLLNLDPLAESLASLYADHPRGRPRYDPLAMLRALILMAMLHKTSIKNFANDLRSKPRLAQIAGFELNNTPAAGTFYLFVDRLENGPFQSKCPHRVLPADSRHGKHLRNLKQEKAEKTASSNATMIVSTLIRLPTGAMIPIAKSSSRVRE